MNTFRRPRRRRGFILLVALIILFALASLVVSMGRSARAETQASANEVASFEASAVERGAEQYVLSVLTDNIDALNDMTDADFARVPVGKGFFWIVRPDYLDQDLPQFGLVDESSKIDLNTAGEDTLLSLPDMTPDIAESIIDWRDADDTPTENGAESSVYLRQTPAYTAKNAPFDTVEELSLVRGVTRQLMYGQIGTGITAPTSTQVGSDAVYLNGWHEFVTVFPQTSAAGASGQPRESTINVNQAPAAVLKSLSPDLTDDDVNQLLAARHTAVLDDPTSTTWVQDTLASKYTAAIAARITGQGTMYSADIVAVSGNGRAFKRCRIIVDTTQTPAQIVYRRDLTDGGFPLDPLILSQLRTGGANNVQGGGGL